jgi:multicomponent Na+:H+ antiporter subunit D
LFITALAFLYAATGTVNMADLSVKIAELPEGLREAFAVLLLVVAAATMVVGVLGAIAQDDIRRILSFSIVSQIGYMIMGLGFFTVAGIAAVVYSMIHHIIIKTTLFLVGGLVDNASGSSRLSRIGGMVRTTPILAAMFLLSALSLAGIPPLSGFVSKFALIAAGVSAHHYAIVAVSLVVSVLTLFAMTRIWMGAFWSPPEEPRPADTPAPNRSGGPLLMVAPTMLLLICSVAVAAAAGPLYSISERTAHQLLDRHQYIEEVLHR